MYENERMIGLDWFYKMRANLNAAEIKRIANRGLQEVS